MEVFLVVRWEGRKIGGFARNRGDGRFQVFG